MNTHIFVSYGHDEYTEKVRVIFKSLNNRNEYHTWWDGDMKEGSDWVLQIENSIDKLIASKPDSCFIFIVTSYSTSDKRYNYCINEILRALEGHVRILPIRLSRAPMPLPIGSIQWFDMTQCEIDVNSMDFQQRLESLCNIIDSREPIKIDGKQGILHQLLNPCFFSLDIEKHLHNYCNRDWLLNATTDWLDNRSERILLIEGGPGTGKTAFALWIATRMLPDRIHAWHLCQYNNDTTRSLLTCVKSLIWYLGSRLPYFYDSLAVSKIEEFVRGGDENAGIMLKEIILQNLKDTHVSGDKIVIMIDALDEASENGINKVAEILAQYVNDMPEWFRFIITSRNDISVTLPLNDVSYVIDLDDESNKSKCSADIKEYVKSNLNKSILANNDDISDIIADRSDNLILYAKLMCDAINKGEEINVLRLPQGLNSYYDSHIRRYFGSGAYDFVIHALPILHLILSSYQPIKQKFIYQRIHATEEWCKDMTRFKRVLDCFGPLLKEDSEFIIPFHKSLSDWFTDSNNDRFYVSLEDGYEKMCSWGLEIIEDDLSDDELAHHFYIYLPQYMIAANKLKDLLKVFSDVSFWERRKIALGVDLILQRMFVELGLMNNTVKDKIFQNPDFNDILYSLGNELFNKGLFVQLKKIGFKVPLHDRMDDRERLTALRYYYINGEYETLYANIEIFCNEYENKELEHSIQNILGLATKKCGMVSHSAIFFKRALQISYEQNAPLEKMIYYHLNLSRVLTTLCRFDEGRRELEIATNSFYHGNWQSAIKESGYDFKARQLELAVRYVDVETELFSSSYNKNVCEKELSWADELYSSKIRIDRYYSRHLQSKILFLLREHRFAEIESVLKELTDNSEFNDIRTNIYLALYQYATGEIKQGLQTVNMLLDNLRKNSTLLIERCECLALIDAMEHQNHQDEITDELTPWYHHTITIINQIITP